MKRMGMHATALAAVIALAACAPQDDPGTTGVTEGPGVTQTDRVGIGAPDTQEFVQRAVEKNLAEIELGRLAQDRATDPQVREFAAMMVEDHTESLNELRQLAQRENIAITEQLSEDGREMQERLLGLTGPEFDREYMQAMVEAHEEMHDLVEDRADRVDQRADAGVTADRQPVGTTGEARDRTVEREIDEWAASTLPTVERHHQRAEEIHERLDDNGGVARQ